MSFFTKRRECILYCIFYLLIFFGNYLKFLHVLNNTVNPSFSNMSSVLTVCSVLASCIIGGSCGDSYSTTYNGR